MCAVAFVALPCVVPAPASASLVITEIMYNPDSGEIPNGIAEWVEIYNSGNTVVNISGWKLSDEDGATDGVAAGTLLNPYEVLVLVSSQQTLAEFQTAWGSGFRAIQLGNWIGTGSLANDPSPTNEILDSARRRRLDHRHGQLRRRVWLAQRQSRRSEHLLAAGLL